MCAFLTLDSIEENIVDDPPGIGLKGWRELGLGEAETGAGFSKLSTLILRPYINSIIEMALKEPMFQNLHNIICFLENMCLKDLKILVFQLYLHCTKLTLNFENLHLKDDFFTLTLKLALIGPALQRPVFEKAPLNEGI